MNFRKTEYVIMSRQLTEKGKILYLAAVTCGEQCCEVHSSCRPGQKSTIGGKVGGKMNCVKKGIIFCF
jgi:hypothetical protein